MDLTNRSADLKFCWGCDEASLSGVIEQLMRVATLRRVRQVARKASDMDDDEAVRLKDNGWEVAVTDVHCVYDLADSDGVGLESA